MRQTALIVAHTRNNLTQKAGYRYAI